MLFYGENELNAQFFHHLSAAPNIEINASESESDQLFSNVLGDEIVSRSDKSLVSVEETSSTSVNNLVATSPTDGQSDGKADPPHSSWWSAAASKPQITKTATHGNAFSA